MTHTPEQRARIELPNGSDAGKSVIRVSEIENNVSGRAAEYPCSASGPTDEYVSRQLSTWTRAIPSASLICALRARTSTFAMTGTIPKSLMKVGVRYQHLGGAAEGPVNVSARVQALQ
jgi:hypothetical protein